MLALLSVWMGLITLVLSLVMLVYRPAMTDATIPLVLWLGAPGAICLGGLVLFASRRDREDPGVAARRVQAWVAITMALIATTVVYALIIGSDKFDPIEDGEPAAYNQSQ